MNKWFSMAELAEQLHISKQAALRLVKQYISQLADCVSISTGVRGRGGKKYLVNIEGVYKLANLKGYAPHGGLNKTMLLNQKSKVIDRSMQPIPNELMSDPIIAVRVKQLEMEKMIQKMEKKIDDMQIMNEFDLLPPPTVEVPPMTPRAKLIKLIAVTQRNSKYTHREMWWKLYDAIYYRMRISVRNRAKNAGVSPIDILERDSLLEPAYTIATELFKN